MARTILIIGESGSGKSTSLKSLNPKETFLINTINKDLPWQGWKQDYEPYSKETKAGNIFTLNQYDWKTRTQMMLAYLNGIAKMEHIKTVIIDDYQYMMSYEFMERAKESGWQKFTDIGQNAFTIITTAEKALRSDQTAVFLCHSVDEGFDKKKTKIKTIGKMLDEKITVEGMFTIVLLSITEDTVDGLKYWFITHNDGTSTAKSPVGMFEDKIPNDLNKVLIRIEEYNNIKGE